jgi:hypothetical protein
MADASTTVHLGENSPEEVAYRLLKGIALTEGKKVQFGLVIADRQWLLTTYTACINAVKPRG